MVAHDAAKPFVIHVGETEIKVLGTSFNVADRIGTKTIEVAVVTGKVVFILLTILITKSLSDRVSWEYFIKRTGRSAKSN